MMLCSPPLITITKMHGKNENEMCTVLITMGNSYCRLKRRTKGPQFNVSSEMDLCGLNLEWSLFRAWRLIHG